MSARADSGPAALVLAVVAAAADRGRRWSTAATLAREVALPPSIVEDALAELVDRGELARGLAADGGPARYRLAR